MIKQISRLFKSVLSVFPAFWRLMIDDIRKGPSSRPVKIDAPSDRSPEHLEHIGGRRSTDECRMSGCGRDH